MNPYLIDEAPHMKKPKPPALAPTRVQQLGESSVLGSAGERSGLTAFESEAYIHREVEAFRFSSSLGAPHDALLLSLFFLQTFRSPALPAILKTSRNVGGPGRWCSFFGGDFHGPFP